MSERVWKGTVHGKVVKFDDTTGIAHGDEVEVIVVARRNAQSVPGAGLRRSEGALADDPEWDAIVEKLEAGRKDERVFPMLEDK